MPKKDAGEGLEDVKDRLLSFESELKKYLENLGAEIDGYKFSVEMHGKALTVEIGLKATVHPKE